MADKINPSHYQHSGKMEAIEIAEEVLTTEELIGAMKFNMMKYIYRAGKKAGESAFDDANKAEWYLRKLIQYLKQQEYEKEHMQVVEKSS